VVFCPEHAQLLAAAGLSKAGVQDWLTEHCSRAGAELRRAGKDGVNENNVRFAADAAGPMKGDGEVGGFSRILPSRQHVPIVVAGARNAAISMVVRVFGLWSGTAVGVETRKAGRASAAWSRRSRQRAGPRPQCWATSATPMTRSGW
jgi:hypothetical protein